jgi:dethiobiotin synthase
MHRFRSQGPLRYWKPVQTGIEQDDDTRTVEQLGACDHAELCRTGIRLPRPLSPHLAARLSGDTIRLPPLVAAMAGNQEDACGWIVEGAGGVLVPLNDDHTMADLMAQLQLPVLVVSRTTLGTINHTLLTVESLRHRGLTVAGVVMVGESNADNREAIEHYGRVAVVGDMPWLSPLTAATLRAWSTAHLDPRNELLEMLR